MELTIFDVEHGAAALMRSRDTERIALIDCGHNSYTGWNPADFIRKSLGRTKLDYLVITNTDQDHYSNLAKLVDQVYVENLYFNPDVTPAIFESLKRISGPLSSDAQAYLDMRRGYTLPINIGFNDGMGGIIQTHYYNSPADFDDFNNLSLACFYTYGDFRILFPGDLERPGWLKLLQNPYFVGMLRNTNVLVAPHHGRINQNYCEEIFEIWNPELVIISDKPISHGTQTDSTQVYRQIVKNPGIYFPDQEVYRKVLTTRSDGAIHFSVQADGSYHVTVGY